MCTCVGSGGVPPAHFRVHVCSTLWWWVPTTLCVSLLNVLKEDTVAHFDPIKVARGKGGRFVPENPEELPPPILTDNKKEDKESADGGGSEV